MLNQCPFCQRSIPFTGDQTIRLKQTLAQLAPGKLLAIKCPLCHSPISLDKRGFPLQQTQPTSITTPQPPPPPNLDWLQSGFFESEEEVEDVLMALVLHQAGEQEKQIVEALKGVGYQVFVANTVTDAIERMGFVNFACIVFHAQFEGTLEQSSFHAHMCKLSMDRRRSIFYILIGEHFHTLYPLEALTFSANLTINIADFHHLDTVLRKSIPDYEALFGPMIDELSVSGKR